jgi:hypothetical protein
MGRRFLAHQLSVAETELASAASAADSLGLDVGEHSDQIHWDDAAAEGADVWMQRVSEIRARIDRVEGLLRAYELVRKSNSGETHD